MSDLLSQVNLLNDYIRTLEKQNQSKTNEIRTLTEQNNQLIQEVESLRSSKVRQSTTLISSSSSTQLQSTIQKLQSELKQSKAAYNLLVEQTQHGNQTQKLREDVRRLSEQKLILFQYKEKLEKELRELGFKSVDTYISKMRDLESQIEELTKKLRSYETRVVDYERKTTLLSNQMMIKTSEIQRLNDKVKSLTESSASSSSSTKGYEIKLNEYETKISQLTSQITISRSQIERLKEKQSQLVILQRQSQNYRREISSLNTKITSLSSTTVQVSSYQTTINSLKTEQKEWEREKQQLQIRISDLQTEIVEKSNAIAQLRLREDYLKTKQSTENGKDREIDSLNSVIRTLRVEIQDHKRTVSYRDSTIKSLQSKISSSEYSKSSEISSIQRIVEEKNAEMNRLIQSHNQKITQMTLQLERYKSVSIANSQNSTEINSLRDENNFLKRETQNNQILIQDLQREKENLKLRIRELEDNLTRSRMMGPEVKTFVSKNDNGENELTKLVRELRFQLEDVKKSNAVIHEQNHKMHQYLTEISQSQLQIPYFGNEASSIIRYHSPQHITSIHQQAMSPSELRINSPNNESFIRQSKHYHQQPYFKSEMNIEKKRKRVNPSSLMSPTRDVRPNQEINNRQKWESLQRKISALRVENDELKRTLLYE